MTAGRNVVLGISWDDTKMGSPVTGVALAIGWDDTKRKQLLGAVLALLSLFLMLQLPAPGAPATGGPATTVIVRLQAGAGTGPLRFIQSVGGHAGQHLDVIDGFVASVPGGAIATLRALPGVASVTVDRALNLHGSSYDAAADPHSMLNTAAAIGASSLWSQGLTGAGVDVALVDSGVTPVAGLDGGKVVHGPDFSFDAASPAVHDLDAYGHGTFMAGLIAGKAADFSGVAPGARLVSVKAANAQGFADVSQVIAAIQWVVLHSHDDGRNIRVLNLSFGTQSPQSYLVDPLAYAAEAAWRSGLVVVVSAGNNGATGGLSDPADNPFVLAVGASADGAPAPFSAVGNGLRNPDLLAPGAHLQSLRVPGSYIDLNYGSTGRIDDRFFRGSGTSEAAAVMSGSVALLLQQRPRLNPNQVKALFSATALPIAGVPANAQGHGIESVSSAAAAPTPAPFGQGFASSTGSGSLDLARGDVRVARNGAPVSGETTWTGSTWTGSTWTGSTWTGSTWTGSTWTGSTWTGSTWTGSTWTGSTWTGSTWTGSTWTGSTWTGSTWT